MSYPRFETERTYVADQGGHKNSKKGNKLGIIQMDEMNSSSHQSLAQPNLRNGRASSVNTAISTNTITSPTTLLETVESLGPPLCESKTLEMLDELIPTDHDDVADVALESEKQS